MSISTYSELQDAIGDWLMRSDLESRIPDFIRLCEAKLNRVLFHPGMEQRSSATVATTSDEPEFISLPTDFQSFRRISLPGVTGKPELTYFSESQLNQYRTNIANTAGQPLYYTVFGDEFELAPTPDDDYELELVYRKNITALSSDDTTNWLLDLAPDLYLYGALVQAAPYLEDPTDKLAQWSNAYQMALNEVNRHGASVKYGGSALRIRVSGDTWTP